MASTSSKKQTMMFGFCEALLEEDTSNYDYNNEDYRRHTGGADSDTEQELSDDDGNRDAHVFVQENEKEDIIYTGKDGTTLWFSNPKQAKVEYLSIKPSIPGVNAFAKNAKTEVECWKLFFNDDILEDILNYTNEEITSKTFAENHNTRVHIVKETSMDEIMALLGLMYITGLNNSTGYNLTDLWRSDGTGVDIFRMTMSLQRFNFLQGCLRFDDAATRAQRSAVDNLALVRAIFDKFVGNCQKAYNPSHFLTLDVKYIPFRGECPFRQFMPKTSAAYGIKMYSLVDAKDFYTINMEINAGNQPSGPYVTSYEPVDIVDRLVRPVSNTGRNITFDNYFTSIPLVTHLLQEHMLTCTGALRKNKKEIPFSFLTTQPRGVGSSRFGFQKHMTLVSHVPKKSKIILLLSSYHHDKTFDITKCGDKPKPEMITFYNSTKTGVENVERLCKMYDVRNYCKSWPLLILFTMLNIAALNSYIVYMANNENSKLRRSEYVRKLGLALVKQHLKTRTDKNNLPRELRKRIFEQVGEPLLDPPASDVKPYKRCRDCPSSKDRKTKYCCLECKKPICLQHVITMCQNCTSLAID